MADKLTIRSISADDTMRIARILAETLPPGVVVILLIGELGAGKTTFVQGLAKGLGVTGRVTSPTFLLMKEHLGVRPLRHIDFYRIAEAGELEPLGILEDIPADTVIIVEWADRLKLSLGAPEITIDIRLLENLDERDLVISQKGFEGWEVESALRVD